MKLFCSCEIISSFFVLGGVMLLCPECESDDIKKDGFRKYTSGMTKQLYSCKECGRRFTPKDELSEIDEIPDGEIIEQNIKLAKANQKFQDLNRVERKSFREYARLENSLIEYNKSLIDILEKNKLSDFVVRRSNINDEVTMVVQLSDLHFNELVDIKSNKYDFNIASQRLQKFADKIKKVATSYNINNILLAFTGDLMNSDRRLDEMLYMATNRSKATFLAVEILQQFILDLNEIANISVVSVTGNESRVRDEHGYSDMLATDNYDFTIFNILNILFKGSDGISFIDSDPNEAIIRISNQNLLLTHGYSVGEAGTQKYIQQLKGRWADKEILIDYVIFGHLHSCYISDGHGRSGSLVGSNSYNENALNLYSKASQNIYLFFKDKSIDAMKIDLQNTDNYSGYDIADLHDVYNAKSVKKLSKKNIILEIVV